MTFLRMSALALLAHHSWAQNASNHSRAQNASNHSWAQNASNHSWPQNASKYPKCPDLHTQCNSYGIDYQNGGSYFQNSLGSNPFTFVSQFEGCQNASAMNLLVDPNGDEYHCTDTNLTLDDSNQFSTCPLVDSQLSSGAWSILVLSDDGNCPPQAWERDFSLSVVPQITATYIPTVTFTSTSIPLSYTTTSNTITAVVSAAPPYTVTSLGSYFLPPKTTTPRAVTTMKDVFLFGTITIIKWEFAVVPDIQTKTAVCHVPIKPESGDPTAAMLPTLVNAAALPTSNAKVNGKRPHRHIAFDRARRIRDRKDRLAHMNKLKKRSPELATITITDTNIADFVTSTSTVIGEMQTKVMTVLITVTSTTTPPPATVYCDVPTPVITVTAATPTRTRKIYKLFGVTEVTSTTTSRPCLYNTITPEAAWKACRRKGGIMW